MSGQSERTVTNLLRLRDVAFWAALLVVSAVLVWPVWIGPLPALTDFGGHAMMADVWVRLDDVPQFADHYARREAILAPNLLPVRFAGWLSPWVEVITGLRLFTTLAVLGLVGSLLWCLRTFQRPRWWVFFGLAWVWNGMFALGLLSFVAVMPLILASAAASWRVVCARRRSDLVLLAALGVAAFFCHGVGVLVAALASVAVLVLGPWRRLLAGLAAWLPAALLWVAWMLAPTAQDAANAERVATVGHLRGSLWGPAEAIRGILHDLGQLFDGPLDGWLLGAVAVCWLAAVVLGATHAPPGLTRAGAGRARRLLEGIRTQPLLVATVAMAAGVFLLPKSLSGVVIAPRFIPLLAWFASMTPAWPRHRNAGPAIVAAAIALTATFGLSVGEAMRRFDTQELVPLETLLESLPHGQRVTCVGVVEARPAFYRLPLEHGCPALAQLRTDAYTGAGFAYTEHNAVFARPDAPRPRPLGAAGLDSPHAAEWDYLIVRGAHTVPASLPAARVAAVESPTAEGGWTLYRIVRPGQRPVSERPSRR